MRPDDLPPELKQRIADRPTDSRFSNPNSFDPTKTHDLLAESSECLACRVIGSGALAGTGLYALSMTRPGFKTTPMGRRAFGVIGAGMPYVTCFVFMQFI